MNYTGTIKHLTGHDVEKLGSGGFSKAYGSTMDNTIVFIVSPKSDPAKNILAQLAQMNNKHIPAIEFICDINDTHVLYKTVFSHEVTNIHGIAYYQAKNLSLKWTTLRGSNPTVDRKELMRQFVETLTVGKLFTSELITAIKALYELALQTGRDVSFDMSSTDFSNFSVADNGILILRDIILVR
jgi:hypothetical protein